MLLLRADRFLRLLHNCVFLLGLKGANLLLLERWHLQLTLSLLRLWLDPHEPLDS